MSFQMESRIFIYKVREEISNIMNMIKVKDHASYHVLVDNVKKDNKVFELVPHVKRYMETLVT